MAVVSLEKLFFSGITFLMCLKNLSYIYFFSCLHCASMIIKNLYYPTNAQYMVCRYNENYKIFESAPTCFGSQRICHQGALYSAWLKK